MKRELYLKKLYCFAFFLPFCICQNAFSQITISGKVYDTTKLYVVPEVAVTSTSGSRTTTDSLGDYHIVTSGNDSLFFTYQGKSTKKFPVQSIKDYTAFDISLLVRVKNKYKLLNTVTVFSNSYQMDSTANRQEYARVFGRQKPGIQSSYDPGGAAGLDLDALIGVFQFRKNKQDRAFRNRLVGEEHDRYVDYRFSAKTISRVTGLAGDTLERYRRLYRPSYDFVVLSTVAEFYEYILNTSYAFKRREGIR